MLLHPMGQHAPARGEELAQDKLEAARVLAADLHPGNAAHNANRDDLIRLTAMDAGGSYEADSRVGWISSKRACADELDTARKAAGYAALWIGLRAAVRRRAGRGRRHFRAAGKKTSSASAWPAVIDFISKEYFMSNDTSLFFPT